MILPPRDHTSEVSTPTTPRAYPGNSSDVQAMSRMDLSNPTTPTRLNFNNASSTQHTQHTHPSPSYSSSFQVPTLTASQARTDILKREDSQLSNRSSDSTDVGMDESDEEDINSDNDSADEQNGRPSKKKKGQRFFCMDYPPCNLSFTRSEHLARHIRKHTGERPFQCHCARRFSRLDNLRQHAQTVHVNEDIPGDSLAATGTRFQRQIRTDRVRPTSSRSRASTGASQGTHSRGHSRNLSASSIASTSSTISTISRDDHRRRPSSLIMPQESSPRGKLNIDTSQSATPPRSYSYLNGSPAGPSTPASSTYSNDFNSPFASSAVSPIAGARHLGAWTAQTHARRLSVPSGVNPFQPPSNANNYPPLPYFTPMSTMSNNSSNSSIVASPTSSVYSFSSRNEPEGPERDPRRRTWHPSTYSMYPRPATSGLSYYQTPDAPRPAFAPQAVTAVNSSHRLPGIDAIDHFMNRPRTPQRPNTGTTEVDSPSKPPLFQRSSDQQVIPERRSHLSWDMSLHQNLTKLDIASGTPPKDAGIWGQQTIAEIQNAAAASSYAATDTTIRGMQLAMQSTSEMSFPPQQAPLLQQESQKRPTEAGHYPSKPPTDLNNRSRRQGWYEGPVSHPGHVTGVAMRTSPEDSGSSDGVPTPSTSSTDYDPSIMHPGYIEASQQAGPGPTIVSHGFAVGYHQPSHVQQAPIQQTFNIPKDTGMSGLEALVAAATSEEKLAGTAQSRA
ncbi:hypothetical protein MMC25_003669 [Agyrium rufum]|nr:hypothetical protein [Agyrium rufum]